MENSKKNRERFFALLKRVDDFPKISNRENQRELGDLFLELEAARANGFLPGHNYLGTSCDITSIAQKLWHTPCTTIWVSLAFRYKESHQTSYPHFSFFAKFVFDQAKTTQALPHSQMVGARKRQSAPSEATWKHQLCQKGRGFLRLWQSHENPWEMRNNAQHL